MTPERAQGGRAGPESARAGQFTPGQAVPESLRAYKTLMGRASAQFIINKSRFIGHGAPVSTEEDALAFLREIRTLHKDASHNCYAYIVGINKGIMRYSDDGEPGGTAGLPIIELLKARDVTNCCVVVTRYFGGVLLGAGGLVRAYAQGAKAALEAARVGVMHPTARYLIELDYGLLDRVTHELKDHPCVVEDKAFTDKASLTVRVREVDEAALVAAVTRVTDARAQLCRVEECYLPWQDAEEA
ncbi:MAG: YigZ family protein [Clostridia bacterium]